MALLAPQYFLCQATRSSRVMPLMPASVRCGGDRRILAVDQLLIDAAGDRADIPVPVADRRQGAVLFARGAGLRGRPGCAMTSIQILRPSSKWRIWMDRLLASRPATARPLSGLRRLDRQTSAAAQRAAEEVHALRDRVSAHGRRCRPNA